MPPREDVGVGESGEEFQVGREGKGFTWTKLVAIYLSLSTLGHQVYKFRRCSPFGCQAKLRGHYVENLCNCSTIPRVGFMGQNERTSSCYRGPLGMFGLP